MAISLKMPEARTFRFTKSDVARAQIKQWPFMRGMANAASIRMIIIGR